MSALCRSPQALAARPLPHAPAAAARRHCAAPRRLAPPAADPADAALMQRFDLLDDDALASMADGAEPAAAAAAPDAAAAAAARPPPPAPARAADPDVTAAFDSGLDDAEARALALDLARVAWETKAEDVRVLHVAPLCYWTQYMVVAAATSRPQLLAVLGKMERAAADGHGRRAAGALNGRSEWELLDFGDVVAHVMTPERREFYDLEGFYGAAEEVEQPWARGGGAPEPAWETKQ
jgi:ribosome-associated protein